MRVSAARYCFIENLHRSGVLALPEYAVLDQWYQWISANVDVKPDLIGKRRPCPLGWSRVGPLGCWYIRCNMLQPGPKVMPMLCEIR